MLNGMCYSRHNDCIEHEHVSALYHIIVIDYELADLVHSSPTETSKAIDCKFLSHDSQVSDRFHLMEFWNLTETFRTND